MTNIVNKKVKCEFYYRLKLPKKKFENNLYCTKLLLPKVETEIQL